MAVAGTSKTVIAIQLGVYDFFRMSMVDEPSENYKTFWDWKCVIIILHIHVHVQPRFLITANGSDKPTRMLSNAEWLTM